MTPAGANTAARELVKAYIESGPKTLEWTQAGHAATGTAIAEMLAAMHAKLYDYFQKLDAG